VLGEMAETLLASSRLRPRRLLDTGYRFRFPELEGALRHGFGTPLPRPA
jgi:NAD dependent epimerase/dehydratase family enzyme